eukprot:1351133-Amorphochlora_amoeboformis.AAC.1
MVAYASSFPFVRHDMQEGDFVVFSELKGMTELNELKDPIKIKVKKHSYYRHKAYTHVTPIDERVQLDSSTQKQNQFELDIDTSKFGKHTVDGVFQQ